MSDGSWIQDSVERLDALEQTRARLIEEGRTSELAEVDEEIRTLYEVLESVAEEAEVAQVAQEAENDGIDEAHASSTSPFDAPPAVQLAPGVPEPIAPTQSQSFSELHVRRSRAPMAAAGLVLLVGGAVGGWWVHQQNQARAEAPAPVAEAKVISAGEIPEDTQEPGAARGGDAERTSGIRIREGRPEPRRRASTTATRAPAKRSKTSKASGRTIDIDGSRDPLAGLQ
jgi:hypothetical protein